MSPRRHLPEVIDNKTLFNGAHDPTRGEMLSLAELKNTETTMKAQRFDVNPKLSNYMMCDILVTSRHGLLPMYV